MPLQLVPLIGPILWPKMNVRAVQSLVQQDESFRNRLAVASWCCSVPPLFDDDLCFFKGLDDFSIR